MIVRAIKRGTRLSSLASGAAHPSAFRVSECVYVIVLEQHIHTYSSLSRALSLEGKCWRMKIALQSLLNSRANTTSSTLCSPKVTGGDVTKPNQTHTLTSDGSIDPWLVMGCLQSFFKKGEQPLHPFSAPLRFLLLSKLLTLSSFVCAHGFDRRCRSISKEGRRFFFKFPIYINFALVGRKSN